MRSAGVLLLALGALSLTGCSSESSADDPAVVVVHVPDGRNVPCIFIAIDRGGSMSCDWSPR